jgi:VWFA-related protein
MYAVALGLLLSAFPAWSSAQSVTVSIVQLKPRQSESRQLQAIVSAVDEIDRPIKGLTEVNFSAAIDSGEIGTLTVQPTAATGEGIAVVLAIDASGSMKGHPLQLARAAAAQFVDQMGPQDLCALMTFGASTELVADFTADQAKLKASLLSISATRPKTYLYQAFFDAASKATTAPLPRTAVVLLTDGKDENSPISLDDAIANAVKRGVPIYPLAFGSQIQAQPLQRIATLTGGWFLQAPGADDVHRLYALVAEHLKHQYLLTIPVVSLAAGQHALTVQLAYRGLTHEARRAFYAAAPIVVSPSPEVAAPAPPAAAKAEAPLPTPEAATERLVSPPRRAATPTPDGRRAPSTLVIVTALGLLAGGGVFAFLWWGKPALLRAWPPKPPRVCAWCGTPLQSEDTLYCQKCAEHTATVDSSTDVPPPPETAAAALVWLDVISSPAEVRWETRTVHVGDHIPMPQHGLRIGRGMKDGLDLRDPEVSRQHAQITLDPKGHYCIENLKSLNHIFVNGKRIARQTLRNGDRLRLGATEMVFADYRDAAPTP